MLAIGCYRFADPIVPIRLQNEPKHVFKWGADGRRNVECHVRLVSKGFVGRSAARQSGWVRIDQRAGEAKQDRANRRSHSETWTPRCGSWGQANMIIFDSREI